MSIRHCIVATLLLLICSSSNLFAEQITLRVGGEQNLPVSTITSDGKAQGLFPEVFEEIARRAGWRIEYIPCALSACFEQLQNGQLDLLFSIAKTPSRAELYDFSKEALLSNWGQIYAPKNNKIESILQLEGQRIAVVRNDTHGDAFRALFSNFNKQATYVEVASYEDVFKSLSRKEADAGVVNRLFGMQHEERYGLQSTPVVFNPNEVKFAVLKGRHAVTLAEIDRQIARMKPLPHSVYNQALEKWLKLGPAHRKLPVWVWPALGLILFLAGTMVFGLTLLRREVARKTLDLQAAKEEAEASEELVRISEERYRQLFEQNPAPMLIYERATLQLLAVNDAFQMVYGYSREEALGLLLTDLDPHQDKARGAALVPSLSGYTNVGEWQHCRKDGSTMSIMVVSHDLVYKDKVSRIAVITDITEQKKNQQELEQYRLHLEELVQARTNELEAARDAAEAANRAKSAFLANMSHELRTPLNAILGFAQLMARNSDLPSDIRKNLTIINRSGEHLLSMINDVLDISKIESGKIEIHEEVFDLGELIQDVGEMLRSRGHAKGLKISYELADGAETCLSADLGKLRQILINIIGNAIKFTDEGGVALKVRTMPDYPDPKRLPSAPAGCMINFEVQDSGPGIPPDKLDSIFDPFTQVAPLRDAQKGTGLGLAITRSFIRMMGGFIRVESELGTGSRFIVTLPARIATAAELISTSSPALDVVGLEPGQPDWRILIVEDTPENVQLLETLLGGVGLATRAAVNGLEAVELVKSWHPHFIWMDIRMPVMDGYEATCLIRQLPGGDAIRIVALTASVFKEQEQSILDCGCNAVLHKPFRQHDLFRTLEQQLAVRFRYADTSPAKGKNQIQTPDAGQLAAVPETIRHRLLQAAIELDKPTILQIAADLAADHPGLSGWLEQQVQQYDFEAIGNVVLQQRQDLS